MAGIAETELAMKTRRSPVKPRSPGQARYLDAMARYEMVFGLGPAGTGKTYLASAMAVSKLISGEVERLCSHVQPSRRRASGVFAWRYERENRPLFAAAL